MVIIIRAIIALNIQRAAEPVVMRGISPVLPARSLPITSYQRAGGFSPMVAHEDVTLARALESIGARFSWTARNSVHTSARRLARAPQGFSEYLNILAAVS